MSNNKIYLRVAVDENLNQAFKKIIEVKGKTTQAVLHEFIKDYLFDNLHCLVINDEKEKTIKGLTHSI